MSRINETRNIVKKIETEMRESLKPFLFQKNTPALKQQCKMVMLSLLKKYLDLGLFPSYSKDFDFEVSHFQDDKSNLILILNEAFSKYLLSLKDNNDNKHK